MSDELTIRRATSADLPAIVRMLANDPLGKTRERYAEPLPEAYVQAFAEVEAQKGNEILVAEAEGQVIGCLQLTMIPGLSRLGMLRAQIESVRVDESRRGEKIGEKLFLDAIERARRAGCGLVQLTTDASRPDARRFYERLGFAASHVGMKLALS
jgi:ribosomal protein S18 acetylase RimI-like enzyme